MKIDYDLLVQNAMRIVAKEALRYISLDQNPVGKIEIALTFLTNHEGVHLPPHIKNAYPMEMSIILDKIFEDLAVIGDNIYVCLSFNGKKERITIPVSSITAFEDKKQGFAFKCIHAVQNTEEKKLTTSPETDAAKNNKTPAEIIFMKEFLKSEN